MLESTYKIKRTIYKEIIDFLEDVNKKLFLLAYWIKIDIIKYH